MNQVEYLPLCDLLFNIISLLSYFSDVVFDLLTIYTLYIEGRYGWFGFTLSSVGTTTFVCQVMSIRWHTKERRQVVEGTTYYSRTDSLIMLVHVMQCGVLWRYFRLFVPVDLRRVKRAVRDLCILRLIHFGGAAGPMLLVHFYLCWTGGAHSPADLTRLHVVSASLCMFSVCWALASFTKHIRQQNLHRLVLTWLGVIYQFMWRLGTVSSRVTALSLYATVYSFWVLLVIALHWLSMCLWLVSNFPFRGEKLSRTSKCGLSLLVTYVYVFCYLHVDLQETNARSKMITFYVTVFLENTLLLALWWYGQHAETQAWHRSASVILVWGGFAFGILFMLLYYRYFHVTRLKHGLLPVEYGWPTNASPSSQSCALCRLGHGATGCLPELYDRCPPGTECGEFAVVPVGQRVHLSNGQASQLNHQHRHSHHHHHHHHTHDVAQRGAGGVAYIQLPGVFNCRLNPAFKRKKKKPTTFIPLPVQPALARVEPNVFGKAGLPFWKKPPQPKQQNSSDQQLKASPTRLGLSAMETNACVKTRAPRVNIQQKLFEKRQKQLQELRVIEDEIKQGKFQRPHPSDLSKEGTLRQPIPQSKKQPIQATGRMVQHVTPSVRVSEEEILLSPNCLKINNNNNGNTMVYYDYWDEKWRFAPPSLRQFYPDRYHWNDNRTIPSDADSQVSLPRSFTLPREFRYNRKAKARKVVRSEHFVTSTNSSDGDVDSGDENEPTLGTTNLKPCHNHINHVAYRYSPNAGSHYAATVQVLQQRRNAPVIPTTSNLSHHSLIGRSGYNRHETQL